MTVEYAPGWMETFAWVLYVGFAVAFLVAFGMGANDCANSYGTVVGAGVLKLWQAYILATIFETLGAGLLGYKVTDTMRKNIVNVSIYDVYSVADENGTYHTVDACNGTVHDTMHKNIVNGSIYDVYSKAMNENGTYHTVDAYYGIVNKSTGYSDCSKYTGAEFMVGELGALIGTAFWLIFATIVHLPVSTTHSAVGATIGFSMVAKGPNGIEWTTIIKIAVSWVASPALAGFCAVTFYLIIKYSVFNRLHPFEASLQMLPVFYFFALSVNTFSILYQGSKYLMFDKLDWWIDLLISLFIGVSAAVVMYFWGKKLIRKRVLGKGIVVPTVVKKPVLPKPSAPATPAAVPKIMITEDTASMAANSEHKLNAANACVINSDSGFELTPTRMSTKFATRNASAATLTLLGEVPSNTPAVYRPSNMVDAKSLKEKVKTQSEN